MRRAWHWVTALLLLGIAGTTFLATKPGPLWRVGFDMSQDYEQVLGVDEVRQIAYTYYQRFTHGVPGEPETPVTEVRGYALRSGERRLTFSLPEPTLVEGAMVINGGTLWDVTLSPDATLLAIHPYLAEEIQLFALPSCRRVDLLRVKPSATGENVQVEFSRDNQLLLVRSGTHLRIMDIPSRQIIREVEIPSSRFEGRNTYVNSLALSDDRRYAAVPCVDEMKPGEPTAFVSVIDLQSGRELGRCANVGVPRFVDNRTLVGIQLQRYATGLPRRFRIEEDGVHEITKGPSEESLGDLLCVSDRHLVTAEVLPRGSDLNSKDWMSFDWLSAENQLRLARWLGWLNLKAVVSVWDLSSGERQQRVPLELSEQIFILLGMHRCYLTTDASLLVLNDGNEITVRELPPRRTWWCWALCGLLVVAPVYLVRYLRRRRAELTA
jgi:hypothetical protein